MSQVISTTGIACWKYVPSVVINLSVGVASSQFKLKLNRPTVIAITFSTFHLLLFIRPTPKQHINRVGQKMGPTHIFAYIFQTL